MPPRATPLDPGERRAALVDATLPLLCARGTDITTKEIAAAAGVAEGTIFRVFPSKQTLFDACIETALDPRPVAAHITGIDPTLSLEERLRAILSIWQRHISAVSGLMRAIHHPASQHAHGQQHTHGQQPTHGQGTPRQPPDRTLINQAVTDVLAPDAERFRLPMEDVISVIRSIAFGTSLPFATDTRVSDPERLVDILLHGVCSC